MAVSASQHLWAEPTGQVREGREVWGRSFPPGFLAAPGVRVHVGVEQPACEPGSGHHRAGGPSPTSASSRGSSLLEQRG